MKSIFSLFFVIIINVTFAQQNEFRLSGVTSFNLNSLKSIDNNRDYTFGVGGLNYTFGVKAKYAILDHKMMLSGGLLLSKFKYNTKAKIFNGIDYQGVDFNASYLQIPLTIGWGAYTSHHVNFSIPMGVLPSVLVSSKSKVYGPNLGNSNPKTKSFIMGYQIGTQLSYTKNFKLFMSLQPNFVFYPKGIDNIEKQQATSFQLFLTAGYIFK